MEAGARPREASLGYGPTPPAPKGLWKALIGVPLVGFPKSDVQTSDLEVKRWRKALERERKNDENLTKRYQDGMTAMHLFFDFLRVLHEENNYFMDETDSETITKGYYDLISLCDNSFVHIKDNRERNFFHHLAGANVHPSLTKFILTRLPGQNFEIQKSVNATDDSGRTVLDYAFDSDNPRPDNVMQLLNFDARFNDKKLMVTDVSELDKLQYKVTQTLAYREQPENVCIELVAHLREQAESQTYDGAAKDRFMTVSEELEDLTVAMLGDATRDTESFHRVSEDHFNLAKKKGLKKYLASGGAQQYVNRKWYGLNLSGKSSKSYIPFTHDLMLGANGGEFLSDRLKTAVSKGLPWYHYTWLIFLFLIQTLFYMLSFSLLSNRLRVLHIPAVAFGAQTVMYCLFVGLLLARVQMHGILAEGASWSGSTTLEVFVILFSIGFILDLIVNFFLWGKRRCQSGRCAKSMTPTFQWENVPIITGYIINAFLFLSLLGYVTTGAIVWNWKNETNNYTAGNVTVEPKDFRVVAASYITLGFGAVFACLNLLVIFRMHSSLGPLLMAFWSLGKDVLYFLVVLSTFGLGFAAVMTSTYHSARTRDPSFNNNHLESLLSSAQSLFWTLFGLFDLDDFQTSIDEETILLRIFVGLWLLFASVILLNMLIGLVTLVFEGIYDNAEQEWKYTRAIAIMDLESGRVFPLPFGWLCVLLGALFDRVSSRIFKYKVSRGIGIKLNDVKSGETVEKVQQRVLQRIREAKSKSPCIRTDVDEIVDKIDALKDRLDLLQSNVDTIVDLLTQNYSKTVDRKANVATRKAQFEDSFRQRLPTYTSSYRKPEKEAAAEFLALLKRFVPSMNLGATTEMQGKKKTTSAVQLTNDAHRDGSGGYTNFY